MERIVAIEAQGIYKDDYQMKILKSNQIEGILTIRGQGVDGKTRYDYDVSGKVSVKAMYERSDMGRQDFELFINQMPKVLKQVERHLLNIHCILMEPEYIFYEEEKFLFCYYPPGKGDIWENIRSLAEFFVKHTDYKDNVCVQMVFAFHKGVTQENYSLEKVTETSVQLGKEKGYEEWKGEKEKHREIFEYDTSEHDWITGQEMPETIMEETDNMWTPVKKFLSRHKKPKWGDFDGLYSEDE